MHYYERCFWYLKCTRRPKCYQFVIVYIIKMLNFDTTVFHIFLLQLYWFFTIIDYFSENRHENLPAKRCDSLINENTPFGTRSSFFQVNEKIQNVPNAFKMHHELTGTGEPVYHIKRQQLKWRAPGLVLSQIYILKTLYRCILKQWKYTISGVINIPVPLEPAYRLGLGELGCVQDRSG